MISYKQAQEQAGDKSQLPEIPSKESMYFAYKGGQCFPCSDLAAALAISKNYEKVENQKVKELRESVIKQHREFEAKAFDIWYAALREEYSDLTDAQFNIVYSKAYEDGHSSGYDEVANEFIGVYDLAIALLKAK